jgi:hypothetical protein
MINLIVMLSALGVNAQNNLPIENAIIKNQGVCDPHIRIFNDTAYLFASHDYGKGQPIFRMDDWLIFRSTDLVNWEKVYVFKPEDTWLGAWKECYATDAAERNGKYYLYFSQQQKQTGVAVADKPEGPYKDALGKPLLPADITPTADYDPAVYIDDDEAHTPYLLWGYTVVGQDYYIARLNDDMISLAEKPRKIDINHGWENDAIAVHKRKGLYYLNSHQGEYGTATTIYGPYTHRGQLSKIWQDHGNFFTWHNQTFYSFGVYEDAKDLYFRTSKITYAYYKDNDDIVIDDFIANANYGVGQYDARWERIEAEWFFAASDGLETRENEQGVGGSTAFELQKIAPDSWLAYPKIKHCHASNITFCVSSNNVSGGTIEIREASPKGKLLGKCKISNTGGWHRYKTFSCKLKIKSEETDICLVFKGKGSELMRLDWFSMTAEK